MSSWYNGMPLKKRRVNAQVHYGDKDDADVISIADDDTDTDDDDSSFSSSSMIHLKIPTQDTATQDDGLSPPSPPLNTQPATIVTTTKTPKQDKKKRKVSMSPKDSLARLPTAETTVKHPSKEADPKNKKKQDPKKDPTKKYPQKNELSKLEAEMSLMEPGSKKTKKKASTLRRPKVSQ